MYIHRQMCMGVRVYIYVYTYKMCMGVYVYMYIYTHSI